MSVWLGRGLFALGVVLLMHSALSMQQFVQYVKQVDDADAATPSDIVVETLAALFVCVVGLTVWAGPFKPLFAAPEFAKKSFDSMAYRPSFFSFNSRSQRVAALRQRAVRANKQ
eukprot:TRINITY_DN50893_c0_g1_i2.p1 TRINITY_DN50893_c0_g1~~TRINITY_DN50893_c0_g1_i2.p1  ORF type:complete len:123 (-),score=46.06 TRINITY_DN50893_c0_g1_i2:202-543(-)